MLNFFQRTKCSQWFLSQKKRVVSTPIYLVMCILLVLPYALKAQNLVCGTQMPLEQSFSIAPPSGPGVPNCFGTLKEAGDLPIVNVKINIHYIAYENESGQIANFIPGSLNDDHWENGNYYGHEFVRYINNSRLKDMKPNPVGLADFIGDTKMRVEIYSDPNNEEDEHNGIWYWEDEPNEFPYGDDVINVIVTYNGPSLTTGSVTNGKDMRLFDWHAASASAQENRFYEPGRTFLHELGHIAGLCHSFSCMNSCPDVDDVAECNGGSGICDPLCGGNSDVCSFGSNNVMSYGTLAQALSPCQWSTMYTFFYFGRPPFAEVEECNSVSETTITISNGQHVVWDTPRQLSNNFVIQANASLHITCLVLAGPGVTIQVERGGKLTIENGEIRRLCEEESWAGIWVEGNRSKLQPSVDLYNPQVYYSDPDVAGMLVLLNATLRGGGTVIQDGRLSNYNNWDYYGGVVIAENSDFIDNKRGCAFMSYPYPTKSYFLNCDFIETEEVDVDGSMGITIWNTVDLLIEECGFEEMDNFGIHGWDFGANISKGNRFVNNRRAIDIYSTFPLSSPWGITIGPDNFDDPHNYFGNNQILNNSTSADIIVESTDLIDGLVIQNNDFATSRIPVTIDGEASYKVTGNSFYDAFAGVRTLHTGNDFNIVSCNTFNDIRFFCVLVSGDNRGLEMTDNDFYYQGSTFKAIYVPTNAEIHNLQGAINDPADNCFFTSNDAFAVSPGAGFFTYFADEVSMPANCELIPVSNGNFAVLGVNSGPDNCNINPPMNGEEHSFSDLNEKRQLLQQAHNALTGNPNSLVLQSAYKAARQEKERIYKGLLGKLLLQQDYALAEQVILEDGGDRAARWQIGLKLLQQDIVAAQQLLNNYHQNTEDKERFAAIMQININRLQGESAYELSTQEENELYEIAYAESPYRSYARSLLSLLKGEEFNDPITFELDGGEPEAFINQQPKEVKYKVYPNPADSRVSIMYPYTATTLQLEVVNVQSGKVEVAYVLPAGTVYDLSTKLFSPGVYSLIIRENEKVLHVEKLVIIR